MLDIDTASRLRDASASSDRCYSSFGGIWPATAGVERRRVFRVRACQEESRRPNCGCRDRNLRPRHGRYPVPLRLSGSGKITHLSTPRQVRDAHVAKSRCSAPRCPPRQPANRTLQLCRSLQALRARELIQAFGMAAFPSIVSDGMEPDATVVVNALHRSHLCISGRCPCAGSALPTTPRSGRP